MMEGQVGVMIGNPVVLPADVILKKRGQHVNQVDYDSEEEPLALPINYNEERASEDNNIAAKINGLRSLVRIEQFHNLVRSGLRANLIPEDRNLYVINSMAMGV